MEPFILLLILVPVIIIILLISIHNKTSSNQEIIKELGETLDKLTTQLSRLELKQQTEIKSEEKISEVKKEDPSVQPALPPETLPEFITLYQPPPIKETTESKAGVFVEEKDDRQYKEEINLVNKNTDWERFIGENLANKIGITVLVLGISFFVKYAIDKDWINETGRVAIGLACGGILIGIAHYIRNSYRSFSSVLMGGGLTVFYFTIAFAFHQYHLISQQAAFIIMVIITAFAVLLSLYYERQELAILATIGGFVTPFLVTTGQENYIALFTYLSILNAGMMILSWFKRWKAINIIALFFTILIYGGWLIKHTIFEEPETLPYQEALLFGTLFYILFVTMNIINNLRLNRKFSAFDFIIVLTVNFLYYAAGMFILDYHTHNYKGIFTASLGILNLILAASFYRKKSIDANFISLLTGLSLTFISLTAPVEFRGNHIVLFWAAETVVLFWLYQRSRIIHLKIASFMVAVLMLGSLLITWTSVYTSATVIPVILNKGFITGLAASVALLIYFLLLRKEKDEFYINTVRNRSVKESMLFASILVAYLAGALEIYYQFDTRFYTETSVYIIYFQLYSFAAALLLIKIFKRASFGDLLRIILTLLCLGLYVFNLVSNSLVSFALLNGTRTLFIGHWFAAILLLWLLLDLSQFFFRVKNERWKSYRPTFTWVTTMAMVLLLSIELYHIILWTNYGNDWQWWENLYYKAGLTILWGICSFTMMWLGMKLSFRELRIISLSLFSLTIIKLFLYDIRNIPPGGKIAAFILLGVLLLTVSFMYQRLKKIIIEDTAG